MADPYEELEAKLQAMNATFAENLPQRVHKLQAQWRAIKQRQESTGLKKQVLTEVHNLAGSGEVFGFASVSQVSRDLEQSLRDLWEHENHRSEDEIDQLFERLELSLAQRSGEKRTQEPVVNPRIVRKQWSSDDVKKILVVEDSNEFAQELKAHLEYFGYQIHHSDALDHLAAVVAKEEPAAILMDIMFPQGRDAGLRAVEALKQKFPDMPPVVFLSERNDLPARLEAVRAGGAAYFTKPVDISGLADALDRITTPAEEVPYRVLIVDDDPVLAQKAALDLQMAGMEVEVVTEPMEISQPLAEFRPELILMDLHMPDCNGIELASVIRQQPAYLGMPIVFLSADTDIHNHLEALKQGGDDFLVKPIQGDHLVSSIYSRAKRARELRSAMIKDSLTGLLNHASIGEQLQRDIARSQRLDSPLSYALIDLDHFKKINDTYGHAVGDQVLVALSRLMKQRFRGTDTIGRYGGEEFAMIMPDTDVEQAAELLNDLRETFSSLLHKTEREEFSVTLSAGVSSYPESASAASLAKAADEALYWAKEQGRNQICIATRNPK